MEIARILAGPAAVSLSFLLAARQVEPVASHFYLFAWYGLIVTCDQWVRRLEGRSLICRCGPGFGLLMLWSAAAWFFFEFVNFRIENWYYVLVTDRDWMRAAGVFLAFATVFPGIFWIAHLLACAGFPRSIRGPALPVTPLRLELLQVAGAGCLLLAFWFPRYCFPLVWIFAIAAVAPVQLPARHRRPAPAARSRGVRTDPADAAGRPHRRGILGAVQLLVAGEVDLHGAVLRGAQAVRNAACRIPRVPPFRGGVRLPLPPPRLAPAGPGFRGVFRAATPGQPAILPAVGGGGRAAVFRGRLHGDGEAHHYLADPSRRKGGGPGTRSSLSPAGSRGALPDAARGVRFGPTLAGDCRHPRRKGSRGPEAHRQTVPPPGNRGALGESPAQGGHQEPSTTCAAWKRKRSWNACGLPHGKTTACRGPPR